MSRAKLVDKLRKIMALMESPSEGEAQAAAAHLARLMEKHNLEIADLEAAGEIDIAGVERTWVTISKSPDNDATVGWKIKLANEVAEHFWCYPMIVGKRVSFVGKKDNLDSMELLYEWFIKQIKDIAREERRTYVELHGHMDPLRWQIGFADGAIDRLAERLFDEREKHATTESTALVVSHKATISDWMEEEHGYRVDGRKTKRQTEREAKWEKIAAEKAALKESDIDAYYAKYPWEHPDEVAKRAMQEKKRQDRNRKARERRWAKNGYPSWSDGPERDLSRENQENAARAAGHAAGDQINIRPHVDGGSEKRKKIDG